MQNKEKVMVFPYNSNFTPILRSTNFINLYDIVCISSLAGWGLCGRDAGYADGGQDLNIIVESGFEEYLDICDTVIFIETQNQQDNIRFIYPKMLNAVEAGKSIICLLESNIYIDEIEALSSTKNIYFKKYNMSSFEEYILNNKIDYKEGLEDINTPIFSVIGLSGNTNKFFVQLELKNHLDSLGYKSIVIGSKPYSEFLGYIPFPQFMSDSSISERDKIYLFNRFIKNIEKTHMPDIIILGVPGGIIPFNSRIDNNFGVTAFEVFQAVKPDICIACIFNELFTEEYFEILYNNIKFRFGFELDAFSITNKQIDWIEMYNGRPNRASYSSLDLDLIDTSIKEYRTLTSVPMLNVFNKKDTYDMVKTLVDKLAVDKDSMVV